MAYPISAGLLISIAIRNRHDFGLIGADAQLLCVREAALSYYKVSKIIESNKTVSYHGNDLRTFEEITGRGYYRPDIELVYRSWCKDEGLLEAIKLSKEEPVFPEEPRTPFTDLIFDGGWGGDRFGIKPGEINLFMSKKDS